MLFVFMIRKSKTKKHPPKLFKSFNFFCMIDSYQFYFKTTSQHPFSRAGCLLEAVSFLLGEVSQVHCRLRWRLNASRTLSHPKPMEKRCLYRFMRSKIAGNWIKGYPLINSHGNRTCFFWRCIPYWRWDFLLPRWFTGVGATADGKNPAPVDR